MAYPLSALSTAIHDAIVAVGSAPDANPPPEGRIRDFSDAIALALAEMGIWGPGGSDVEGPGLSVNGDIAIWDGVTGALLADGGYTIAGVVAAAVGVADAYTDAQLAAAVAAITAYIDGHAIAGDVTGTLAASVVSKINGATVPAAGALTTGNGLYVSGASALSYSALNLAGGAGYVTGVLPVGNQASQTMAGDVTGTTAVSVVEKIHGATVPAAGALTTGNGLYVSGASALSYSALNLAGGAGYVTGALPVANIAVGSAGQALITIGGVATWSDDFQAANLTTTGSLALNTATPLLRLGLASGSGAGSASATGNVRVHATFQMLARNAADTADISILDWGNFSAARLIVGSRTAGGFNQALGDQWRAQTGTGGILLDISSVTARWGIANVFTNGNLASTWGGDNVITNGATGATITLRGMNMTGTGTVIGGALAIVGGAASGAGTSNTGANAGLQGGAASNATTNIGGDATMSPGLASTTDGSCYMLTGSETVQLEVVKLGTQVIVSLFRKAKITTTQMPANTGDGVLYVGNVTTAPTASPVSGGLLYASGGLPVWYGSDGSISTLTKQLVTSNNKMVGEATYLASARNIFAIARGSALTTTEMPTNSGNLVCFLGDAGTNPSADAVSGIIMYSDGARPAWRFNGTNFKLDGTSATATNHVGGLTLPALANKYLSVYEGGTNYKIPMYDA